jgi:hypothetical protein
VEALEESMVSGESVNETTEGTAKPSAQAEGIPPDRTSIATDAKNAFLRFNETPIANV